VKRSVRALSFALLIAMLLSACSPTQAPSSTSQGTTAPATSQADLSPASTEPSAMVTVTSADTKPATDVFAAVRESNETWLAHGLRAYESGKEPMNLRAFFTSSQLNLSYLTLYEHMFVYDEATSITVAEALFRFICDEFGPEALTDLTKRTEYKTAYLQSLGIDMAYTNTPELEALFASMKLWRQSEYKYILSFDNIHFYFPDFTVHPSTYNGLTYYTVIGLKSMIAFLEENGFTEYVNPDRDFHFFMPLEGGISYTKENGMMYINDPGALQHEAVHAMGITSLPHMCHMWLKEGICTYIGQILFETQWNSARIFEPLALAAQGYYDAAADSGDALAVKRQAIAQKYLAAGGILEATAEGLSKFDFRLYYDLVALYEFETKQYETLYDVFIALNPTYSGQEYIGQDLSYAQAGSMVAYLAEDYGLETVLKAHETQDLEGTFGKGYEALKADWLAYLAKFK